MYRFKYLDITNCYFSQQASNITSRMKIEGSTRLARKHVWPNSGVAVTQSRVTH